MSPHHILFIATRAFSSQRGGIERFSLELGRRFVLDGHRVHYLSVWCNIPLSEEAGLGTDAPQLFLPDQAHTFCATNRDFLTHYIRQHQIDVILNQQADNPHLIRLCDYACHHTSARLVTILHFDPHHYVDMYRISLPDIMQSGLPLGHKLRLWVRNTAPYRWRQRWLSRRVFRQALCASHSFVLLSQHVEPCFRRLLSATLFNNIRVIPNPLTASYNHPGVPPKEPRLLFVGRMSLIQKRPDLMLQVWQRLCHDFPTWTLTLVGDGEYLPTLRQLAARRGLERIEFVGRCDARLYYPQSSILCITSNTEGFSLVCTEASAHYVVPVAFDSYSVVHDVIHHGVSGLIVPAFHVDAYVTALRQLMSDPDLLRRMALQAHQHAQSFSMDRISPLWYQLFDDLPLSLPLNN